MPHEVDVAVMNQNRDRKISKSIFTGDCSLIPVHVSNMRLYQIMTHNMLHLA